MRLSVATNAPPVGVNASLAANTNQCPIGSVKCSTPIDLGDGKTILMDNSGKDDLLF